MEAYDGLVRYFTTAKLPLNESFLTGNELDRWPTIDKIIAHTLIEPNDASGILPYPSILNLYGNGCKTDNNEINCTEACGDVQFLFQDWQTMWNCLTLVNMALTKPHLHHFDDPNTTGDASRTLSHLAIANLARFDALGVLQKFVDCSLTPYDLNTTCSGEYPICHYDGYIDGPLELSKLGRRISRICDFTFRPSEADIAGPGVSFCSIPSRIFKQWSLSSHFYSGDMLLHGLNPHCPLRLVLHPIAAYCK